MPFYKKTSFWIKLILALGAATAPFVSEESRKIIMMIILGA